MLRQNIKAQSRSKSKGQKTQINSSRLINTSLRSSQSNLKIDITSAKKVANSKAKYNNTTERISTLSKGKDRNLQKSITKILVPRNTQVKIGVNTTIRKRIQSNNENIHPNIIQSNTSKPETKSIRDVRLANTKNQSQTNAINNQLKTSTLINKAPLSTNLIKSKLNQSVSKSKQNLILSKKQKIQKQRSKSKQSHKYTLSSHSKSKNQMSASLKHLDIPKIKVSPASRYSNSQDEQDSLLMYIPPSIIIEHLKIAITDFRFIAITQQQQYFKDVLAQHLKTNTLFTIRIIDKNAVKKQQIEDQLIQSLTIHLFLNKLQLPHIQTLYTIFQDANSVYLLLEPMLVSKTDNHTLSEEVHNQTAFDQFKLAFHTKDLINTLSQLHKNSIILRDINIQFLKVQFGTLKITLIDCIASLTKRSLRDSFLGDIYKMPQELALGKSYERPYDIWNVGIVLYTIITGNKPFSSLSLIQEIDYRVPLNTSRNLNDFICHLLVEQNKRLTADAALSHPFLQKLQQPMIPHDLWRICQHQ